MPAVQLQRFEQILERMISRVVARTQLSDVGDTSVFKHLLAATAREIDETYYQLTRLRDLFDLNTAVGEDLDERAAEIQPGTISRLKAARSVGTVVFSRAGTTGTVIIPTGTIVKTGDNKVYRTTIQSSINAGNTTSQAVAITSNSPGSEFNVPAGTIVRFGSKIPGIDSVTNAAATTQGLDVETDDAFRTRILGYIASLSRSTVDALEFAATGLIDTTSGKSVVFASVFEDPLNRGNVTLYIDDGAGTAAELGSPIVSEVVIASALGGEEFLYLVQKPVAFDSAPTTITSSVRGVLTLSTDYFINPASGQLYFTPALVPGEQITASYTPYVNLIALVQKVVDGDPADRANFPGYVAAGVRVIVKAPIVINPSVEAVLTLEPGFNRSSAIAAANLAVQNYINTRGISGDIIRNELVERIMGVAGVRDVSLILPGSNINVLDNEIARVTSVNINIT